MARLDGICLIAWDRQSRPSSIVAEFVYAFCLRNSEVRVTLADARK